MSNIIEDDIVRLAFGQSLVMNNLNDLALTKRTIKTSGEADKHLDTSSFGLFESATPNFHTYYPDVKLEDLTPKEEDFVNPVFRALSEVIVNKKYDPIDFGMNRALRGSTKKLLGQAVFPNHEAIVGNEVGSVSDVIWQDSYTADGGIQVPGGINATFKIDAKSHPNIARKILMSPPAIHSDSVTVMFGWQQSHPKMDRAEFYNKIATYGEDKQLIRRVVTEIKLYSEVSLVSHGADPFAQVMREGKINNPSFAETIEKLAAKQGKKSNNYFFSYKEDLVSLSAEKTTIPNVNNISDPDEPEIPKPKFMKKEFLIKLAAIWAFAATMDDATGTATFTKDGKTFDEEAFTAEITNLQAAAVTASSTVATLTSDKANLTSQLTAANLKVTELTAAPKDSEALIAFRETAIANYKKVKGDKAVDSFSSSLGAMDYSALQALNNDYLAELETKYPSKCTKCGSTDIARNSAKGTEDAAGKVGKEGDFTPRTAEEVTAALKAQYNKLDTSRIHGNTEIKK